MTHHAIHQGSEMTERLEHHVIEVLGWSYVVGPRVKTGEGWHGPWRYRWEAQEEADKLNAPESE